MADDKQAEYWDLYNPDGSYARTIQKGSVNIRKTGCFHIAVEVIPTDHAGHLLITRRALGKVHGGKYEFPAGSVLSGETPQEAAARELTEETGLTAHKMIRIGSALVPGLKRIFFIAYIPELTQKKITLQPDETIDYRFVSFCKWLEMIAEKRFTSNRLESYTQEFFDAVEKAVGKNQKTENAPQLPQKNLSPYTWNGGSPRKTTVEGEPKVRVYNTIEEEKLPWKEVLLTN